MCCPLYEVGVCIAIQSIVFRSDVSSACFVNKINDRALTHPDMLHGASNEILSHEGVDCEIPARVALSNRGVRAGLGGPYDVRTCVHHQTVGVTKGRVDH